jgi:hypothetical protein
MQKQKVEGRVKKITVNHYIDGTADTEIELEDGTRIVYSDAAPIAKGNEIVAFGRRARMRDVMKKLHPQFFILEIEEQLSSEYSFIFPLDAEVIDSDEIYDKTTGIAYKERKGY